MNQKQIRAAVEAMLFASGDPVSPRRMAEVLETDLYTIESTLQALRERYEKPDSGLCLLRLNDNWQLATRQECGVWVKRLMEKRRNAPLGPAAMETLTIIAYNQPVSRSFIEQVRGVDSSSSVAGLLEKGLIEEAGRLELPGRPISFRTTEAFLRVFGLSSLKELPPLHREEEADRQEPDRNGGEAE